MIEVIDDLTLTQKYSLLLLNANSNQAIPGRLWFQKELFLISQNIRKLDDEAEFEEDLMGPYSENAEADLERLKMEGLVESNGKIKLTQRGIEVANRLMTKTSKESSEIISDMKNFLNDLSEDELLGFIYFSYPKMVLESIKFEHIRARRDQIALSLFRRRKVSLGKAAKIAGLSQEEFIKVAQANKITVFSE